MTKLNQDLERHFVWRRAFRSADRCVKNSDLTEAFGMSTSKASTLMTSEAEGSGGGLRRVGYRVESLTTAKPPRFASMGNLLEMLDKGFSEFAYTGLRADELPVNYWGWCDNRPASEEVLAMVVSACVAQKSICIEYVSMKRGDTGKWRRIAPLCLERMGDQWRLTAHDLDKEGCPLRTFVLARIIDATADSKPIPRTFIRANPSDSLRRIPVELDTRYTDAQRAVLNRELQIQQGVVSIPHRCAHEFGIRFAGTAQSVEAVWPPLKFQ